MCRVVCGRPLAPGDPAHESGGLPDPGTARHSGRGTLWCRTWGAWPTQLKAAGACADCGGSVSLHADATRWPTRCARPRHALAGCRPHARTRALRYLPGMLASYRLDARHHCRAARRRAIAVAVVGRLVHATLANA